ncbi:sulfotransferase [Thalassobaculum sp.]|uniref:sulfotransferase n=1 Tax=Thalassobaculum sp. TaxID=2022740 RepID=UPI0032EB3BC0
MAAPETHAEAQARYRTGDLLGAKALFESALADDPGHWASRHDLGFLLRQLGERAGAFHHIRASIALAPEQPIGWTTAGLLIGDAGSFQTARRSIDRARLIAPAEPTALIAQADLVDDDECPTFAAQLSARLRQPDLPDRLRARLLHALGRVLDRLDDTPQAFAAVSAAHAIRRRSQPYDPAGDTEFFASIQAACGTRWWDRPGYAGRSDVQPIFIVGMPRSGTTMLEQMLSRHPDVTAGGETLILQSLLFSELPRRLNQPFPECLASATPSDYAWVAARYAERMQDRLSGATLFTDKLPANFLLAGPILKIFPDARILNLVRNPLDTCVSCYLTDFALGHNYATDLADLGHHFRLYRSLMAYWHGFGDPRLLDIDYEGLVAQPEATLTSALSQCGLSWDPACLDFDRASNPVNTASWQRIRTPLDAARTGRWRRFDRHLGRLIGSLTSSSQEHGDHARRALVWEPDLKEEALAVLEASAGLRGRDETARQLARLLPLLAADPRSLLRAASSAERYAEWALARTFLRAAARMAPGVAAVHTNLAVAHGRLGETAAATDALRRALSLTPNAPEAASNLGNFLAPRDLPRAATSHRRATMMAPYDPGLYVNLGMTLMRNAGTAPGTERALHRAIALDPASQSAGLSLYHLEAVAEHPEGAVLRLDRLRCAHPTVGEVHYERGCALRDANRDNEATESLRRAIVLAPQFTAWRHVLDSLTGHASRAAPIDYVRELFDQYAERFDHHLTEGLRYRTPVALSDVVGRADPLRRRFGRVLDLGCGTGLMGAALRDRFTLDHLTGIDVSGAMLAKLVEKGGYDATVEADIETFLERPDSGYDLIVAADVLVYFGSLERLITGAGRALAPGGILAISVEEGTGAAPFELKRHGRYAHRRDYIEALADACGLSMSLSETAELRDEGRQPVVGLLMVLEHFPITHGHIRQQQSS